MPASSSSTTSGRKTFYATYTAYSGRAIRSELIETSDFERFTMTPLTGTAARNKGMALFPRKINGQYAMIGRQDNENLYLIYSDDLYSWGEGVALLKPRFPWEFVQIGNCGSPIELDEGWLLLTHGVGPMRRYSHRRGSSGQAGPSKVLARLPEPLLRPERSDARGLRPERRLYLRRHAPTTIASSCPTQSATRSRTSPRSRFSALLRAMVP